MSVTSESWLQAQYSVLGSAIISPELVPRVISQTREDDFTGPCRTVYQAMREIFQEGFPVDIVSLAGKLGSDYRSFLTQLMEITPTAANIERYISLCREQSMVLSCRDIGKQMSESESSESIRSLVEQASGLLTSVRADRSRNMSESLRRFMEKPEQKVRFLSWPIHELEKELFVGPGKFLILGAEPSVGKTAFALQCAWQWSSRDKVGFFSFETDPDTLFERLISGVCGIPMQNIKLNRLSRKEWDRVCQATQEITRRKLDLISAAGMTTSDIRAKILESGYKVILVDYLQIVNSRGSGRYEQVTNISIDLHNIAQSLGVTIFALAQLSRTDEERTPRNSDLRESGQIEQDADVIMMLQLAKRSRPNGPRNLFVTKNKEGQLSKMILNFDGVHQTFSKGGMLDVEVAKASEMKQKYKADSRTYAPVPDGPVPGQMDLLPDDTEVPFTQTENP